MIGKNAILLLLVVITCCGCGDNSQPSKTHKETIAEEGFTQDSLSGSYKHYTGTIAGQPIVLHYMEYGTTVRGEYYYKNIGRSINLYNYTDTVITDRLLLTEMSVTERGDYTASWEVNISGDSITGTWVSGNGNKTKPIRLKEDYTNGVERFGIVCIDDSASLKEDRPEPKAYISCQLLLPVGNDEATSFIRSVVYRSMNCDTNNKGAIKTCLDLVNNEYFTAYQTDNTDSLLLDAPFYNWSKMTNYWVTYNENNMVVLNHHTYEYTGGAHGNHASNYICIDATDKKVLALADILNVHEEALVKLLEKEARIIYKAKDTEPLNAYMLAEELHIPEQFYITPMGITFVYGIYEVAAYADGEINLFIPYTKLKDMLTPYFKQRMGLQQSLANK